MTDRHPASLIAERLYPGAQQTVVQQCGSSDEDTVGKGPLLFTRSSEFEEEGSNRKLQFHVRSSEVQAAPDHRGVAVGSRWGRGGCLAEVQ